MKNVQDMKDVAVILQRAYAAEAGGMFRFLINSRPAGGLKDAKLLRDVAGMSRFAAEQSAAIEGLLDEAGVEPHGVAVPAEWASLHDVGVKYLLPRLIEEKRGLAEFYEGAAKEVAGASGEVRAFLGAGAARHRGDWGVLEGYLGKKPEVRSQ
jgi:hypothetical protein